MTANFSVRLNLPVVPEVKDPELFDECLKIYSAIQSLASSLDLYTSEGSLGINVEISAAQSESVISQLRNEVAELKEQMLHLNAVTNWGQPGEFGSVTPNTVGATEITADLVTTKIGEVKEKLKVGTTLKVVGAFGVNGSEPSERISLPADAVDATTTAVLANAIKDLLINFGLGS